MWRAEGKGFLLGRGLAPIPVALGLNDNRRGAATLVRKTVPYPLARNTRIIMRETPHRQDWTFKMNKIAALKVAARVIVGVGTTSVTNSIIRNNVTPTNLIEQISVGVATLVIGSMASTATKNHTDAQIDALADAWKTARTSSEDAPVTA